ncbi:MAG: radical SAM protein [Bacteroidaceae bacterium]|nr:radical SAM protein [Bacteroidaceae bacterium]
MSTIIYSSPIFGPVHSRRLGVSLGINLLPGDGKVCSFDCVYCECGLNADHRPKRPLPTPEEVGRALTEKLRRMGEEGVRPDVLTFAGNGEPTLHPLFPEIVREVRQIRDALCPQAQLSILSNATQIHRQEIREALRLFDNNIQKLDTVDMDYIRMVDRPQGRYEVEKQIEYLAMFEGKVIIQTMFMGGELNGKSVDNTGEEYVVPYLQALQRIGPNQVMIYTIDRETPVSGLKKASHEQLDAIAQRIRDLGIATSVSY